MFLEIQHHADRLESSNDDCELKQIANRTTLIGSHLIGHVGL